MYEISDYLQLADSWGIIPNFWLSSGYLQIQKVSIKTNNKLLWIEEDDWVLFPPLPLRGGLNEYPKMRIWSDFANFSVGEKESFLDWEYTYYSDWFKPERMVGKEWAVFRKNSRKWARGRGWRYSPHPPSNNAISALLIRWLESKDNATIEDFESMEWFLMNGTHRGFIYDQDRLVGINVWEESGSFLIYRYCITDPEEPFLNEFARLLFYQSMPGKMVIDGGSLNDPGLERFKDKLNPIRKRAVYSRRI